MKAIEAGSLGGCFVQMDIGSKIANCKAYRCLKDLRILSVLVEPSLDGFSQAIS